VTTIRERLRDALRGRSEVRLAVLFGSQARGGARADSDVDVAVIAPGVDPLSLAAELSRQLGQEVEIVSLEDPPITLVEAVLRDGVVVHESLHGEGATWRARTLATLETDRPWFARMREAWLARVARQGL
jgi:predicted nucleotidyltransferase